MKNLFNDTLKHNGKWSRKSVTWFTSFAGAMFYEFVLPFVAYWLGFEFNSKEYVFQGLLLLTSGLVAGTIADKKIENNSK